MMKTAREQAALSRRSVLWLLGSATVIASFILVALILPAEFGRDPIGVGRLIGVDRLWAPAEQAFVAPRPAPTVPAQLASHSFAKPFRSDFVDIRLAPGGDPERRDEVEYKVNLKKGVSAIYSWQVPGIANPEEFYTEFHGHTIEQGKAMTVAYYRKATGTSDNGVITAPFDGVHGWFFQNQSERPVTVRLKLAGFYDLVPAGQPGNETGLIAKPIK